MPYDTSSLFLERCHSFFLHRVHQECQITTEMKRTTRACGKRNRDGNRDRSWSRLVETTGGRRRRKEEEEKEEEYARALSYHISFVPQQHGR